MWMLFKHVVNVEMANTWLILLTYSQKHSVPVFAGAAVRAQWEWCVFCCAAHPLIRRSAVVTLTGRTGRSVSVWLVFFFCYDFEVRPWQGSPRDCESPKHPPILLFPRVLFLGCPPRNTTPSDPPVSVSLVGQEFKVSMTHFTFTHKKNRLGLPIVDRKKSPNISLLTLLILLIHSGNVLILQRIQYVQQQARSRPPRPHAEGSNTSRRERAWALRPTPSKTLTPPCHKVHHIC